MFGGSIFRPKMPPPFHPPSNWGKNSSNVVGEVFQLWVSLAHILSIQISVIPAQTLTDRAQHSRWRIVFGRISRAISCPGACQSQPGHPGRGPGITNWATQTGLTGRTNRKARPRGQALQPFEFEEWFKLPRAG